MKKKVLDRPMFKGNDEEMDVENVGIMAGFKELFEGEDDDLEEDDDMYSSEDMLDRRPDSPEILMNNLRGDMRSIDARREELADMVGYDAAMETPDEVLALLQSSLGAGIGALPMGAQPPMPMPMPAPQGAMPPQGGMPMPAPEPMPMDQGPAPINMANGGIVQRFQEGSDEDGVTPVDTDSSSQINYSPEIVSRAQQEITRFISQRPMAVPTLQAAMNERIPVYQSLLGGDSRQATQGQALMDIGGAFLSYAANRGPQGEVLRGSPASRLAGAFRGLPAQIGTRAAELAKQEQAIKLAALQAGEKEVEAAKAANIKLVESQRKFYSDVLKQAGKGDSPFGKGLKGSAFNILVQLAPDFAMGKTGEDQDRKFESAVKIVTEPEFFIDELGNRRMRTPELPDFVKSALQMRNMPVPSAAQLPSLTPPAGAPTTEGAPLAGAPAAVPPATGATAQAPAAAPVGTMTSGSPTLFGAAERGTGIIPVTAAWLSKFPFMGNIAPGEQQATTFIGNSVNQLNRAIATNPRFAEGERQQIQRELDLFPKLLDNPDAFRNRLIGLDELMTRLRQEAAAKAVDQSIAVKDQIEAREKVADLDKIRSLMGVPPRVRSLEDFRVIPIGGSFLYQNAKTGALEIRTRYK